MKTGFTLLEVLVAVAILGFSLTTILAVFSSSARLVSENAKYITACELAERKLFELSTPSRIMEGRNWGDFGDKYPNFSWEAEIVQMDSEFPEIDTEKEIQFEPQPYYMITLRIFYTTGARKEKYPLLEIITYRTSKEAYIFS